jgi:twinfilin-like protein
MQVQIAGEELVEAASAPVAATDEAAFESAQAVLSTEGGHGNQGEASYVLLRLPSLPAGAGFVFLLYVPPGTAVRDRMLYASTQQTLKRDLGAGNFAQDMYGNLKDELDLAAYQYSLQESSGASMTETESELENLKMEESEAAAGGAQSGVSVAFAIKDDGKEALAAIAKGDGTVGWVSLGLNVEDECVELAEACAMPNPGQWAEKLPEDRPRYFFISGFGAGGMAFVFYCPDAAPIKQKMLSSTVKAAVLAQAAALGAKPLKTLEIRDPVDFTPQALGQAGKVAPKAKEEKVKEVTRVAPKGGRKMPPRKKK